MIIQYIFYRISPVIRLTLYENEMGDNITHMGETRQYLCCKTSKDETTWEIT